MTPSFDLTPFLIAYAVLLVVGIGVYLWYAFMLAKVFARLGTDTWKAWVPLLNEAEIFRLGGVPSWSVVFLLLPLVQLYGLYLKGVAASRLNAHFGRGPGATVLAVLLPPVWATLLARGAVTTDPALQERIAPAVAERSGYAFAVSTPQPPAEPLPPAPGAPPPPLAPPLPPASPLPPVPPTPPAGLLPPPPPASGITPPAPPAPPVPPPAPPARPGPPAAPPVDAAPAVSVPPPPPSLIVPPPGIITPPPLLTPPPAPAPVTPSEPADPPAQPWVPLDRPTPPAHATPPPPADAPAAAVDDEMPEELDRTVVVDRRPVVPWTLAVEGGPSFRLTGTRAVLGRRPDGAGAGAQEIAVPDSTRTLSKVHARLELADAVWTVTDLNATNGVIVIEADGTETLLDPGASAPLAERFVLGKVGLRLTLGDGGPAA